MKKYYILPFLIMCVFAASSAQESETEAKQTDKAHINRYKYYQSS